MIREKQEAVRAEKDAAADEHRRLMEDVFSWVSRPHSGRDSQNVLCGAALTLKAEVPPILCYIIGAYFEDPGARPEICRGGT